MRANDYYWVGGAGNWSDLNRWATTSGGNTKQSIIPSLNDNVIFDANSGFTAGSKTVSLNIAGTCNNMTWSGSAIAPIFNVSNNLQINGSLKFQPGMTVGGGGPVTFSSPLPNQTITTGNIAINVPFTFNSSASGGWILQDSLKLPDGYNLSFTKGDLNFNGQYVKMGYFAGAATSGILNIANSTINVTGNWTYSTAGSTPITALNSVNSQITINGNGFSAKANDMYFNVIIVNNASLSGAGVFNKVTFLNGGTIGAVTADSLILTGAKVYNLTNTNIKINKYLKANMPACSGLIELIGAGTVTMSAGAVADVVNARIQNITIQGPAVPYIAISSIDIGGNTGWSFTAPAAHTYYWVGGGGNWNDVSHWASSSNGTAGSGCVPTQFDDVMFDANSGFGTTIPTKTVTLDGNAYCNNMTWIGAPNNPILTINNALQINASLQFQPNMTTTGNSSSPINFTTSLPNQTITTASVVINSPITFNGTGGWDLQDSLKVPNQIVTFTNGNLNFNSQYANMKKFSSVGGNNTRTLNIANSTIDVGYPGDYGWIYNGGVPLTAPNSINSEIRVTVSASNVAVKTNDVYYNVTFLASSNGQSTISNGIYNKVSVVGGTGLSSISNIITDSLILQAVGKYLLGTPASTVRKYFKASPPPCSGLIELGSSTAGSRRNIVMAAGAVVDVSNARIQDIGITGATPYTASGSIDLGNNSGWTFTAPAAHTYYWVGGSGNWNDGSHWANISGGTAGSGCVPTQFDNVIFDGGSGFSGSNKTVTVDGAAYCDSMTWAGIAVPPTFNVNQPLQIDGSLKFQTGMTVSTGWPITFTSSKPNETITTGNVNFSGSGSISFNGTGGWKLLDSLKTSTGGPVVIFTQGNLDLSGQYIRMCDFGSTSSNLRNLNIANATIDMNGSNGLGKWSYTGTGSTPLTPALSANSLIRFSGVNTPSLTADPGDVYNNVIFQNVGIISSGVYNRVDFLNNGTINNSPVMDTLLFTPSRTYTFQSGTTTTINKIWYASGNPCFPTTIQASATLPTASISMPRSAANMADSIYSIDFVHMKNMNAITGTNRAVLETGNQSIANDPGTDPGFVGNTNWINLRYAGPSGITGLGADSSVNFPYTLNTVAFHGNPSTTYLWNNNSTADTLVASRPGTYSVKVDYGSVPGPCSIKDTIVLLQILPVRLISFKGNRINGNDVLNWVTATEENSAYFDVEYSTNGTQFSKAGTVQAAGNSSSTHQYQYTNSNVTGTAYYRLKMVDIDKSIQYSSVIKISGNAGETICLTTDGIYPVPFTSELNMKINSCKDQAAVFILFSSNGSRLIQQTQLLKKGTYSYQLHNLSGLAKGYYLLRIQTDDGSIIEKVMK